MSRYLIVGGETAANPEVVEEAESILAKDKDAVFTLLVPATHVRQYLGQHKGEDEEVARRMAEAAQRRFKESGIPLDYYIGPPDPVQAVDEEWAKRQYDQVIEGYSGIPDVMRGLSFPAACRHKRMTCSRKD